MKLNEYIITKKDLETIKDNFRFTNLAVHYNTLDITFNYVF